MNPPSREEILFQTAVQLPGPERTAFLDRECGEPVMRARLEALLAAHDAPDGVLASQTESTRQTITFDVPDVAELPDPAVGMTIGRYKLLEKLGEGGCGVVYVAEQTEPVRRRVALKVIKLGMDTKQVVARFAAERQALAMMDHPNIAKVLDAGTIGVDDAEFQISNSQFEIPRGRPYFVMELVRGIRITDYCDQNKLPIKERLDLFIKICQAIQHAHQKGIIHRDIKPSNILVTLHDGVPVPKVIDFGIAKATQGKLTDATVYTQLHQFIGTPAYMSPEQAEMSGLDIDTRSDIYSLGVLLYELLTGKTPFDAKELIASGVDAMRKTIREQEPVRPSTRLRQSTLDALPSNRPHANGSSPSQITNCKSQIDPDLDWIVMKCLEKDRARRYETANGLAADLKRHLNSEPVVARPPSASYRLQRAWRRNRLVFTSGTVVVAALIVGLGLSIIAFSRERRERERANTAERAAEHENERAQKNEQLAQQHATEARHGAYLADMAAVQAALDHGNVGRAQRILEDYRPKSGYENQRDFEWFHFDLLARADESRLLGRHPGGAHTLLAAPDGTFFTARRRAVPFGEFEGPLLAWNGMGTLPAAEPINLRGATAMTVSEDGQLLAVARGLDIEIRWRSDPSIVKHALTNWHRATRHPGPIHSLCFIDRDTRLVASDLSLYPRTLENVNTPSILLIDVETDTATEPDWSAPLTRILSFARSTRGDALAVLGSRAVVILSLPEGVETRRLARDHYEPPSRGMMQVLFVDDDRRLVTTSDAGAMDLWDVESGRHLRTIGAHDSSVAALAVSPDGRLLASAGLDHQVRIWDLQTEEGATPRRLRGHVNEVWGLAFLPDGSLVSCGRSEESVRLWDVRRPMTNDSRWPLPAYAVGALFTQSAMVAAVEGGLSFDVSNLGTMDAPRPFVPPPAVGDALWIPLAGATHALAIPFPLIELIPGRGVPAALYRVGDYPHRLSNFPSPGLSWQGNVHVEEDTLFVHGHIGPDPYLVVYNLHEERPLFQEKSKLQGEITMSVVPGGRMVVLGNIFGRLEVRDIVAGTSQVHEQEALTSIQALVALPDQRSAFAAGQPGILCRLDLATGKVMDEVDASMLGVTCMALSPNGRRLATGDAQGIVTLWDVDTLREIAVLGRHDGLVFSVYFLPDGDALLSVDNYELRFWRAPRDTRGDASTPITP